AISDAACSARSVSRSLISTLAPCSQSSSAVARPMPRAEPVTIATLSSRTPMAGQHSRYEEIRLSEVHSGRRGDRRPGGVGGVVAVEQFLPPLLGLQGLQVDRRILARPGGQAPVAERLLGVVE